jgi:hypothetical protein
MIKVIVKVKCDKYFWMDRVLFFRWHVNIRGVCKPGPSLAQRKWPVHTRPQNPNTLLLFFRPFFYKAAQLLSLSPNCRHLISSLRK